MKNENKYKEELEYQILEGIGFINQVIEESSRIGDVTDLELGYYNLLHEKYNLGLYKEK